MLGVADPENTGSLKDILVLRTRALDFGSLVWNRQSVWTQHTKMLWSVLILTFVDVDDLPAQLEVYHVCSINKQIK